MAAVLQALPGQHKRWRKLPLERRREAVALWISTHSNLAVAEGMGVAPKSVRQWRATPWWAELCDELREGFDARNKAQAREIIEKAQREAIDRLDHGDEHLGKDGEVVRLKVKGRDAAIMGAVWLDKLRVMEGKATRITAPEALTGVLAQFQAMAEQYKAGAIEGSLEPSGGRGEGRGGQLSPPCAPQSPPAPALPDQP